jgi:hypothetical protein
MALSAAIAARQHRRKWRRVAAYQRAAHRASALGIVNSGKTVLMAFVSAKAAHSGIMATSAGEK